MPANFKTYDAQARLLAAVVAAHPELKLNYKAIAQHYGSEATVSSIEHRFRPVKEQSKALREAVARKIDPKGIDIFDKNEIARIFGSSTPDGISFQFRSIKKEGNALLLAANNGEAPAALPSAREPKTPRKPRTPKSKDTPGSGGTDGPATASARKKRTHAATRNYCEMSSTNDDESPMDYDALDDTPVQKKIRSTPTKMTPPGFDENIGFHTPLASGNVLLGGNGGIAVTSPLNQVQSAEDVQEATPSLTDDQSVLASPSLKFEADLDLAFGEIDTAPASHGGSGYVSLFSTVPPESQGLSQTTAAQQSFTESYVDSDQGLMSQDGLADNLYPSYQQTFDDGEV